MLPVKNCLRGKIAVIADDLTGSNEVATIMVKAGKRSLVVNAVLKKEHVSKLWEDYEGLVFNLNSRNFPGAKAYSRIKHLLLLSRDTGERLIYKKMDSTLKGNVGKEIAAILDAGYADISVLVPALPQMGRITVGGYHLVEKVPLGNSLYVQDFSQLYVPELLQGQTERRLGHVSLQIIESGTEDISRQLMREYRKGSSIVLCDCCTQDDLRVIKQAILSIDLKVLPAGSAGLFKTLYEDTSSFLPCLIVCGSLNRITRQQLRKLVHGGECGCVELGPFSGLANDNDDKLEPFRAKGERILRRGKNLVIATSEEHWGTGKEQKDTMMKSKINQCIASLAAYFIERFILTGLIVTGGDTAMALLKCLDAQTIEIVDELEPFVPVGVVKGSRWEGMNIITKAGGFGEEGVFLKAVNYLTQRSRTIGR